MGKRHALSTGYVPRGGLPRNSVYRLTDRPNMTSAVYRGRKALTQHQHMKIKTGFSQKSVGHFEPNFVCKLLGKWKLKSNDMMLVT